MSSMAKPIVMNLILWPGIGWVMKLLEGWTNRLNKYDLIYACLTDEAFWVSAAKAQRSVSVSVFAHMHK